jgi:hypothetical protein
LAFGMKPTVAKPMPKLGMVYTTRPVYDI